MRPHGLVVFQCLLILVLGVAGMCCAYLYVLPPILCLSRLIDKCALYIIHDSASPHKTYCVLFGIWQLLRPTLHPL